MFKILDGRTELWQWDLDRKIVVDDPTIAEVHFCNGKSDCSLVTAVRTENGKRIADIPNILLQDHPQCKLRGYFELRVFAYCAGDYTKTEETIKVNARTKPESYEYTETAEVKYRLVEILQTKGDSETAVMSQKAVSVAISDASSRVEKRITNIERGLTPEPFETDDSMAYQKDVPANALPYAEIAKIGGMTYKDGDTLRSAKVTEVKSVGANLLPFPYANNTKTTNGITFTVNGDGSITANGTATDQAYFDLVELGAEVAEIDTDMFLSGCPEGGSTTTYGISIWRNLALYSDRGQGVKIPQGTVYQSIYIVVNEGVTVNKITFKPKLNKGTTAQPYTPYVKRILPIPEEVRPANGIDENVYDYIEWAEDGNRKQVVRCGVVDLGTIGWAYNNDSAWWYSNALKSVMAINYNAPPLLAENYKTTAWADKAIGTINQDGSGTLIVLSNDSTTKPSGLLYYELAEPIITDISTILPADNLIGVEGGGTITFENEHGNAVPSEITYQLKGATA